MENTVTTVCYGSAKIHNNKSEAKDYLLNLISRVEGAERERYVYVLLQIERGLNLCTDDGYLTQ